MGNRDRRRRNTASDRMVPFPQRMESPGQRPLRMIPPEQCRSAGRSDLAAGKRQKIRMRLPHRKCHLAHGLNGIGKKQRAGRPLIQKIPQGDQILHRSGFRIDVVDRKK